MVKNLPADAADTGLTVGSERSPRKGNGNPLQYASLGNPTERGAWWDEMVGEHHQLNGHEFEQSPGDGGGQGSLVCCSPRSLQESNTTEQLNNNSVTPRVIHS